MKGIYALINVFSPRFIILEDAELSRGVHKAEEELSVLYGGENSVDLD